jgi:actin-related protein
MIKEVNKICIECKNSFVTHRKRGEPRRFCSDTCRTRHNSKKDYHKNKDSPEYKEYKRGYFKKWLDKNRTHFNEMLREPNRIRASERRIKWKEEGLCHKCGKEKIGNYLTCLECRTKAQKWRNG